MPAAVEPMSVGTNETRVDIISAGFVVVECQELNTGVRMGKNFRVSVFGIENT